MTLNTITPAHTAGAQFAEEAVTGRPPGKQLMTTANPAKKNAKAFIGSPHLPKLHLACGRGSPRRRFKRTQPIESMYVDISASRESEMMMLNAKVLPRLIKHSTQVKKLVA